MRVIPVLLAASLLPLVAGCSVNVAQGQQHCAFSEPRALALDTAGVRSVQFSVGGNRLRVDAAPGAQAALSGTACASRADALKELVVRQERRGDRLLVTLERPGTTSWFGSSYAGLNLTVTLPDDLALEVTLGSGDAQVTGAQSLTATVGSGDLDARRIAGAVSVLVGSGDATLEDIGSLEVRSLGSGDIDIKHVRGAVTVGSVGSGDFELDGADGAVEIGTIGSGDVEIARVSSVRVGSLGSGDLTVTDVSGDLGVRSKGSGSIRSERIGGTVNIPPR